MSGLGRSGGASGVAGIGDMGEMAGNVAVDRSGDGFCVVNVDGGVADGIVGCLEWWSGSLVVGLCGWLSTVWYGAERPAAAGLKWFVVGRLRVGGIQVRDCCLGWLWRSLV